MENNKPWLIVLSVLVIIVVLGGLGLFINQNYQVNGLRQEVASSLNQLSAQIGELKIQQAVDQSTIVTPDSTASNVPGTTAVPPVASQNTNLSLFSNATGGYSFQYSQDWKAYINKYNTSGSLFGPNASTGTGLGGIEVTVFAGSLNDWINSLEANTEISFISNSFTKIDGFDAMKATIKAQNRYSSSVYILKNGKVYGIYINSTNVQDLEKFNQIINSFKFIK